MLDYLNNLRVSDFQNSSAGTNAGVTLTQNALTGSSDTIYVSSISGSGDAAAIVTLTSNSIVLWRQRFASAFTFSMNWTYPVKSTNPGKSMILNISASTSNCEANMSGFYGSQ